MLFNKIFILVILLLVIINFDLTCGIPAKTKKKYDLLGSYDLLGVCLRNCAQCKKMFGVYFEGQMCADACVKLKGKVIPDCEDIGSIAPYLNKFDQTLFN